MYQKVLLCLVVLTSIYAHAEPRAFKGRADGGNVELQINTDGKAGQGSVFVDCGPAGVGELKGRVTENDSAIELVDSTRTCKLSMQKMPNGALKTKGEEGCMNFHGASCDFGFAMGNTLKPFKTKAATVLAPLPDVDTELEGTILIGSGKFAVGNYTYLHTNSPVKSPCDGRKVSEILLWNPQFSDSMILKAFANKPVTIHGSISCPNSGIQFSPNSAQNP